jgi:hypothetical protein
MHNDDMEDSTGKSLRNARHCDSKKEDSHIGPQPSFDHKLLSKTRSAFRTVICRELACATGASG